VDLLKPGNRVYVEQGPAEPRLLVEELMRQVSRTKGIELIIAPLPNVNRVPFADPAYTEHWRVYSFFGGQSISKAMAEKRIEYVPIHLSEIPAALGGDFRPDFSLIQVTPPDSAGLCNFGVAVDYNRAAIEASKTVIAQVNYRMPTTCGNSGVYLSEIDYIVEGDTDLIQVPGTQPGEKERQIAENVVELIPDGSTIQIGLGTIPDAILTALHNKRDLGIHSGFLCEKMLDLIEAGVVTGNKKEINPRTAVAGVLLGTDRLYKYCDRNPIVELHPTTYTHDPRIVSRLKNFISINSVIEIDLTGQINAEMVNGQQMSGVGGQADFARIARLSPGGKSIIAMPSSAKGRSKIVPHLNPGMPVSNARADVDYVVTEYGVADLRYRSLSERAKALIKIAHPDFRDELKHWVRKID
jgi:4-hydroxybutyrate CoA-transferase